MMTDNVNLDHSKTVIDTGGPMTITLPFDVEKKHGFTVNGKPAWRITVDEGFQAHWKPDMTEEQYHADKSAVNSTSLRRMLKSPKAFYHSFFLDEKEESTPAMKFGTLAHMAILEGAKFKEKYIVMPEFLGLTQDGKMSAQSKAAKEKKAAWLSDVPQGSLVVTIEERDRLFAMIDSVLSHEHAYKLFSQGKPEAIGYWRDQETGIKCKLKADFVSFNLNALVDVKTTTDCRWDEFRDSVEGNRYDVQNAFYREGLEAITGKDTDHRIWLAIESKAPYEVGVYEVPPQYEGSGKYEVRKCLRRIKSCIDQWSWPQAQVEIEFGEMSPWFYKRYELTGAFDGI